ncbi:BTB/POZ domain-containing protein [Panicum miliaceum]|uniref:BTB/POZ domain-containing protein n=1 Tax=Panicum miliaceum TaxID=4540 RepID=A0A3L6QSP1_PANMI|nr:BTB/POZ domain-containing protein [Panicum miliaceum]
MLSPRHQSRGSNHTSSRLGHHLQRRALLQDREEGGIRGGGRRAGRGVPPHLPSTCTHSLPPRFNTPDPDPPDGIAGYCCDSRCLPYHKPAAPATGGVGERGGAGMEMSRGWQELGVVDTIYEDDHEEEDEEEEEEEERFDSPTMSSSAATSRSCSPEVEEEEDAAAAHPSLPPALRRAVQAWSRANGSRKPDVIVRVQDHRLPLHKFFEHGNGTGSSVLLH